MKVSWALSTATVVVLCTLPGNKVDAASVYEILGGATPGTACGEADQEVWKTGGYGAFDNDIEFCTLKYLDMSSLGSGKNDRMPERVSLCMQLKPNYTDTSKMVGKQPYSASCADCMGVLSRCTADNCVTSCFAGKNSNLCRTCTEESCIRSFYECSGLNTMCDPAETECIKEESTPLPVPVIVGIAGGAAALLLTVGLSLMCCRYNQSLDASREEFSKQLAAAAANAPKLTSPVPMSLPDMEAGASLERPIVMLYAFLADHPTELTASEGEELTGIQIVDGEWWLARNKKGKVGIVPKSYVEEFGATGDEEFPVF